MVEPKGTCNRCASVMVILVPIISIVPIAREGLFCFVFPGRPFNVLKVHTPQLVNVRHIYTHTYMYSYTHISKKGIMSSLFISF